MWMVGAGFLASLLSYWNLIFIYLFSQGKVQAWSLACERVENDADRRSNARGTLFAHSVPI